MLDIAAIIIISVLVISYIVYRFLMDRTKTKVFEKYRNSDPKERFRKYKEEGGAEYAERMAKYELDLLKRVKNGVGGPIPPPPEPPKK